MSDYYINFQGVEERTYPSQKWATTEQVLSHNQIDEKKGEMFWALFGYIQGKNEKSQKISMTVPVSTKVSPTVGDEEKESFQMGFYIPKEFQADPPIPTDERVKIVERDLHVYTM